MPTRDITVRTLLSRLETKLDAQESRYDLRFDGFDRGHMENGERLVGIDKRLTDTQVAIARVEGEREAEKRMATLSVAVKKPHAILGLLLIIPTALLAGWQVLVNLFRVVAHAASTSVMAITN